MGRAVFEVMLHGETRSGYWILGTGYWILDTGLKVMGVTTHWDDSKKNEEVKGNPLKNSIHRNVAPVPFSEATG